MARRNGRARGGTQFGFGYGQAQSPWGFTFPEHEEAPMPGYGTQPDDRQVPGAPGWPGYRQQPGEPDWRIPEDGWEFGGGVRPGMAGIRQVMQRFGMTWEQAYWWLMGRRRDTRPAGNGGMTYRSTERFG